MWVAAAAGIGIAIDYHLNALAELHLFEAWWFVALGCLTAGILARRRGRWNLATAALLACSAAIGAAWHHWHWNFVPTDELARFALDEPRPTCVEAVLEERVQISPPADRSPLRAMPARTMSEATVRVERIRDGETWRDAGGLSRLRVAGALNEVGQGDRVRVFAQFARPPAPLNPAEYDWQAAERRIGRFSELYCDNPRCVILIDAAPALGLERWLGDLRAWCEDQLAANVALSDAPLVLATLLGDQERLSESTKDAFLKTGSIHLLVVSGAHVALLAGMAWRLARGASLSRLAQLLITGSVVVLYAAIVGPQPSVMRATALTIATLSALVRGRAASAGNLLGGAALFVMAYNPCELFRAGTQFSFLAVAVLIAFARWSWRPRSMDPLERLIDEARPSAVKVLRRTGAWFVAMTAASLAVGVAMAPLVAHHFNVVTPASILLTPIAGPLISIALAAGAGIVTIGWLLQLLGAIFGAVCGGCLHLAEQLVFVAAEAPGSYFYTPGLPGWWLIPFYGVAGALVAIPRLRPAWHWQATSAMTWLAIGYAAIGFGRAEERDLRCTFLSMGHGTCVVMELPSGQTILYDAGSLGSPEVATRTISSFLWSRGIDRIDAVVLSHADIDHYNAIPGLIERFPIGVVYISPMMFDPIATGGELTAPNYLRGVLTESGVPLREVWMGDRLRTDDADVTIEVLHPPREGVIGRDNANSVLLAIEYAGKRLLLPGDLESPGIEMVMADPPLDCDILLAPHHGSAGSDPPGFAAWSTPEWVVMSGRRPDRTTSAQQSYMQAGASVLHTALNGAVTCTMSPAQLELSAFRGDRAR
jgi:competence protein ComEC